MGYINITREELENLYTHDGLNRKELRYLLRITPNRIPAKLSELLRKELNPFKSSDHNKVEVRGFVHSPPKKLIELFNKIHYQLLTAIGQYSLLLLSSSPMDMGHATPIIIPNDVLGKTKVGKAHFVVITGELSNFNKFDDKSVDASFIVVNGLNQLGFKELFSTIEPSLKLLDLKYMLKDRFNTPELESKSVFFWLMSSPVYEGRVGGNALSPISPAEDRYKCDIKLIDDFQRDLLSAILPYFRRSKTLNSSFDYISPVKTKLNFFTNPELHYSYEKSLAKAKTFLEPRDSLTQFPNAEVNLSTTTIALEKIKSKPLESFIQHPIIDVELLNLTDLPMVLTNSDLYIDQKETDLFDYSMDISQLIYLSYLKIPTSTFDKYEITGVVKDFLNNKMKALPELRELMFYGIPFNLGTIGGLGEHFARISNSIMRTDETITTADALIASEDLFNDLLTKLFDEFEKPIIDIYHQLEEKQAERDQIKSHKLRNVINSILFELNNIYSDGWRYELFEDEMKKRTDHVAGRIKEIFQKLISQKEVTELSPGLFFHILGFDRFF